MCAGSPTRRLSNGYPRSVIFPAVRPDDRGRHGRRAACAASSTARDETNRGVGEMMFTPAFTRVAYTDEYQAELVAEELKRRGYRTIGWVGSGAMPHKFVARVEQELAGGAIRRRDRVRRPAQGDQERGGDRSLIRLAAEMQDEIFARVLQRRSSPACATTTSPRWRNTRGALLGSEQGLFLGSSAPLGQASRFIDRARIGFASLYPSYNSVRITRSQYA